jgi:hypothetical protein
MFNKHNMFSFFVFSIVLLNGVLALFYGGNIFSGLLNFSSWEETAYCLVMAAAIGFSIYGGTLVAFKQLIGLKICIWVYAIQLFGVITESFNFVIIVGFNISTSTDLSMLFNLHGTSLEFNLVALLVLILSGISLSTLKRVQSDTNCT